MFRVPQTPAPDQTTLSALKHMPLYWTEKKSGLTKLLIKPLPSVGGCMKAVKVT